MRSTASFEYEYAKTIMLSDIGIVAFVPSVGSLMPSLTFSFDLFFEKGAVVNQFVRSGQPSVKPPLLRVFLSVKPPLLRVFFCLIQSSYVQSSYVRTLSVFMAKASNITITPTFNNNTPSNDYMGSNINPSIEYIGL